MGVETALLAAAVVSATASVAGGISASSAARKEANLLNDQAGIAQSESMAEAQRRANEVRKFQRKQKLAFLKNGVTLEGSPLLVLDETLKEGQEEVDAIVRSGTAQANYYRQSAAITRQKGRAALIGGFGEGAATLFTAGSMGAFGKAPKAPVSTRPNIPFGYYGRN